MLRAQNGKYLEVLNENNIFLRGEEHAQAHRQPYFLSKRAKGLRLSFEQCKAITASSTIDALPHGAWNSAFLPGSERRLIAEDETIGPTSLNDYSEVYVAFRSINS